MGGFPIRPFRAGKSAAASGSYDPSVVVEKAPVEEEERERDLPAAKEGWREEEGEPKEEVVVGRWEVDALAALRLG